MIQRIREVEREMKYEEYAGREGDIVTGIIQQSDSRYTLLDLGRVEALLPQAEQVPYERPEPSARLKAYIVEVRKTTKGPQIVVSRTHPGLIKRLFELEVPEIADGVVEIKACAREPGHRTKIAVWSNDHNVDPVGACVGARGARVRMVVNELRGEKIDIVPFSEDPPDFVTKALSPAKVKEVRIDEETGTAEVIVPDYQLSLAIGKEGQNARLAARLTGWRVDIKSETQLAEEEAYADRGVGRGRVGRRPETGELVWQPAEGGDGHVGRAVEPAATSRRPPTATACRRRRGDGRASRGGRRRHRAGGRPTSPRSSRSPPPRSRPCTSRRQRRTPPPTDEPAAPDATSDRRPRRSPAPHLHRLPAPGRRRTSWCGWSARPTDRWPSAVHCPAGARGCAPARPRASTWPVRRRAFARALRGPVGSRPSRPWPSVPTVR